MFKYIFTKKSNIEIFWKWFSKHEKAYFHLENNQDKLLHLLNTKLKNIQANLAFEFSQILPTGYQLNFIVV